MDARRWEIRGKRERKRADKWINRERKRDSCCCCLLMLSCRERKTHKYGFAGVIGRGYSLTWQERESCCALSLALCWNPKPLFHSNHATWHNHEPLPFFLHSPSSRTTQSLSVSSPHHIPFSCFLNLILCIITFLIINFPQIFLNFSLPHSFFSFTKYELSQRPLESSLKFSNFKILQKYQ